MENLINVPLTLKYSVPHVVTASYGACSIMLTSFSRNQVMQEDLYVLFRIMGLKIFWQNNLDQTIS
jgi:hypothetical protein